MNQLKRGFTLIELLVVMAIIGILSSVVLTNLNSSRAKARDAVRIGDVQKLRLALELYFDIHGKYPGTLRSGSGSTELAPTFISTIPTPPAGVTGVTAYTYVPVDIGSGTCNGFHLGVALEQNTNDNLTSDTDLNLGSANNSSCMGVQATGATNFSGLGTPTCTSANGTVQPNGTEACYDVTQ
jgi:prepilin-type N-terminal cleavage/methylation domain-containing protein